jgi:DNA mismatch endonuclease (patch repair protein)
MADNMTPGQRSYTMSRIGSKNTKAEVLLRSLLHRRGLRFRIHVKRLPGTPDIVFTRQRIAVFVDGDFWHGYKFEEWKNKLQPYWSEKITRNRLRDKAHTTALQELGWTVVRIWEHEMKHGPEHCAARIERAVKKNRSLDPPPSSRST